MQILHTNLLTINYNLVVLIVYSISPLKRWIVNLNCYTHSAIKKHLIHLKSISIIPSSYERIAQITLKKGNNAKTFHKKTSTFIVSQFKWKLMNRENSVNRWFFCFVKCAITKILITQQQTYTTTNRIFEMKV